MQLEEVLSLQEIRGLSDEFTMDQYHKMADLESSLSILTIAKIRGNLVFEDVLRGEMDRPNSRGFNFTMGKLNRLVTEHVATLQEYARELKM